jgi:hypothetical protein
LHGRALGRSAHLSILALSMAPVLGCSGSSTSNLTPSPTPSPTSSNEHLYVSTNSGQLLQFPLPLTSTSTPSVTLSNVVNPGFGLAVDSSGNIATADRAGNVAIYTTPLTNSSTPTATFHDGGLFPNLGIAFDASGALFVPDGSAVEVFTPPFSSTSVPSRVISLPANLGGPSAVGFDRAGNLYVASEAGLTNTFTSILPLQYTSISSTVTVGGLDSSIGYPLELGNDFLAVILVAQATQELVVFDQPLGTIVLHSYQQNGGPGHRQQQQPLCRRL